MLVCVYARYIHIICDSMSVCVCYVLTDLILCTIWWSTAYLIHIYNTILKNWGQLFPHSSSWVSHGNITIEIMKTCRKKKQLLIFKREWASLLCEVGLVGKKQTALCPHRWLSVSLRSRACHLGWKQEWNLTECSYTFAIDDITDDPNKKIWKLYFLSIGY